MAYRSRIVGRHTVTTPTPMNAMNITPLIDVLLVLLVMMILSIPIATNTLEVDLPAPCPTCADTTSQTVALTVDRGGSVRWNGNVVTPEELATRLSVAARAEDRPIIRFEPDGDASYDASVRVINAVADAGDLSFSFAGNERHRTFSRQ